MNRFLRLFPAFRAIEAELEECASARIAAEDQLRYARSKAEMSAEGEQAARAELNHALKQVANFEAIRHGSLNVPFPDVFIPMPEPQQPTQDTQPLKGRTFREIQQMAVMKSRKEADDRRRALVAEMEDAS